ncbi:nicotinamide n-methyltransferase [Chytridiales sp. JEL 0842]|nr:nicotinamide n-methyltransferase [Chytridiales sp. JEL 0842]
MTGDPRDVEVDPEDMIIAGDMFEEPPGFRPPTPEGTVEDYERNPEDVQEGTPAKLELYLIGKHSLWAHRVWNAGIVMARYLDKNKHLVKGKRVLELGAAASIPSMISVINGAEKVVITDWPEPQLMNRIKKNLEINTPAQYADGKVAVVGYQWGQEIEPVLAELPDTTRKFDLVLLADLIFNHTEHANLLKTCLQTLDKTGSVLVFFTHHVVKWADRDLKFFQIAEEERFNFKWEKFDSVKATAMFPDDVGDLTVRETVHCYRLWLE